MAVLQQKSSTKFYPLLLDNYSEDEVELKLLHSTPACFIILGKPFSGKTTLAKKLSKEWLCPLISPDTLLQEALEDESNGYQTDLKNGIAIREKIIFTLFQKRMSSPDLLNTGYVLDGFPAIFDKEVPFKEQLNMIKNQKVPPNIIINVKMPNEDIIIRRRKCRWSPITGEFHVSEQVNPTLPKKEPPSFEEIEKERLKEYLKTREPEEPEQEYTEINTEEEESFKSRQTEFPVLSQEIIDSFLITPNHIKERIERDLNVYASKDYQLQEFLLSHNRQNVIELNGNIPPKTLYKLLSTTVKMMCIKKAFIPVQLVSQEAGELDNLDIIDLPSTFNFLGKMNTFAGVFRWKVSRWHRRCPVEFRKGFVVNGLPSYAVKYIDKIYFLSSEENLNLFLQNPRPYLDFSKIKYPVKFVVLGHPKIGKSIVCEDLAFELRVKWIQLEETLQESRQKYKDAVMARVLTEATERSIKEVEELLVFREHERQRKKREEELRAELAEKKGKRGGKAKKIKTEVESGEEEEESLSGGLKSSEMLSFQDLNLGPVTADHPEVIERVLNALKIAENEFYYPEDDQLETILKEIEKVKLTLQAKQEIRQWIVDDFPINEKLLSMFIENSQHPSCIIILKDNSPNYSFSFNNWKAARPLEPSGFSDDALETETEAELERLKPEESTEASEKEEEEEQEMEEQYEEFERSMDSQEEFQVFLQSYEKFLDAVPRLLPTDETIPLINIDVFNLNFQSDDDVQQGKPKSSEEIVLEITRKIESLFNYTPRLFGYMDKEQEDEDLADTSEFILPDVEPEEQRNLMRQFGDSAHYCPVALKDRFMLIPGETEFQALYKDKVYRFSSKEARLQFMENPRYFTATSKPLKAPPLRIMMIGVTASGKSTQGRCLARKLNNFHMNYKRRIRQLLFPKAGRKIGFPYQIDKEDIEMDSKEIEAFSKMDNTAQSMISSPVIEKQELIDAKKIAAHLEGRKTSKHIKTKGREAKIFVDDILDDSTYPTVDSVFTQNELMFKEFLQERKPLPNHLVKTVIMPWWSEEPYRNTGFVLESFPSNEFEARLIIDEGLFPDIVIFIRVTEADVIQRMMPRLMTRWQDRTKKKMDKRKEDKKRKEQLRLNAMAKRKAELEFERRKKKGKKKISEAEEENVENIDAILQEEFPPVEEEEVDFESAEEAESRFTAEMMLLFRNEEDSLNKCKDVLEANNIHCIEVPGNKKPELVTYLVNKAIASLVENRESLFERTYALSNWLAERLIGSGYKVCTNFGRWCPVQLLEVCLMPPNYADDSFEPFPVLHRSHVYFLSSEVARQKFIKNPLKYICQKAPRLSIPLHISIVGPLFSGTSTLSKRFTDVLGMQCLSIGSCMRYVLNELPHTALALKLTAELVSGYSASMEYVVNSIETALMQPWCQLRGAILVNIPKVCSQMRMLSNNNIVPFVIFELDIDIETALQRNMKMKQKNPSIYPLPDCETLVNLYFSLLKDELGLVKEFYQRTHRNWVTLDGNNSTWLLWTIAKEKLDTIMESIYTYIEGTEQKKAVPIANLALTPDEFIRNMGVFQNFCPVSLVMDEELVEIEVNNLEFSAEYKGKYFKLCNADHLQRFLSNPDVYLPPINKSTVPPSDLLPHRLTLSQAERRYRNSWSFNGFCPVSYIDGYRRYDALVKGNSAFTVEYKNKAYCMETEEKREKFMRKPQKYSNVVVPSKLPPSEGSAPLKKLPLLGFLEQSVAAPLIEAITAVGNLKPKYPFLDPSRSALLYIAYYLKAYNPDNWERIRIVNKRRLGIFKKRCELLRYLCQHMTRLPWEPEQRPPDFEEKLKEFFSLELPQHWQIFAKQLPKPKRP